MSYQRVLGRDGNGGDKEQRSPTRKLACGHVVSHAATISYNIETGATTYDKRVWCDQCEQEREERWQQRRR
jgi:hypothetical protein